MYPAPPAQIMVERSVAMKTRDGVTLRADIYRPAAQGTYPVLLQRTPYNKDGVADFGRKGAARGYIVVIQDVRGRYSSEGEWYTFKHEMADGWDTVEWAAALPGSNGKVGMFGGSYVGATQMLAAIARPPHLAGICPVVTASNYHENWTYQGGAFEQWFNESWTSSLAQDTLNRAIKRDTNALVGSAVLPLNQYPVFNLTAPRDGVELTHALAPYFIDWLAHPLYDDYWKQWSIEENYQNIDVPALTIAAWYDIFQGGSLRNYMGLKAHAGTEGARSGQRLLVTIGGHAGRGRRIGAVDFGPAAEEFDENNVTLDWYDYPFLGGMKNEALLAESDATLVATVRRELSEILGLRIFDPAVEPEHAQVSRWRRAMAQYSVGHQERMKRITERLSELPGLRLAGNAYEGIGIPDCIRMGRRAAKELVGQLQASSL